MCLHGSQTAVLTRSSYPYASRSILAAKIHGSTLRDTCTVYFGRVLLTKSELECTTYSLILRACRLPGPTRKENDADEYSAQAFLWCDMTERKPAPQYTTSQRGAPLRPRPCRGRCGALSTSRSNQGLLDSTTSKFNLQRPT